MVSADYVKAEVARAVEQLQQCQKVLADCPPELATKTISLASGAAKNAATLLGVLRDSVPAKAEDDDQDEDGE